MTFDDLNSFGKRKEPFLFISDFKAQNLIVIPLNEIESHDIEFCIDENYPIKLHVDFLEKKAVSFSEYKKKFDFVIEKIKAGDTYLLNLTQPTAIKTTLSLKEI
ncbi:MAG TPA: aminodeoxychorismate synthase component I, partial [Sulfurimonas sp. UBA10385]